MRTAKIFAVSAAVLLVCAVAVGTLGPDNMSLGEGIASLDKISLADVERYVRDHFSAWLWDHPVKALLGRPLWLIPASISLICAGAAATAATNRGALNSRRRRS